MIPDRDYQNLSASHLATADTSDWIAVLPLGAFEQHGPHLPFETDTIIAQGVADRLSAALPETLPVTFLPAQPIGYSVEHMDFSGSRTLSYEKAINQWVGIGKRLAGQGIRKLLLLNAHGGNSPLMTIAATEMRVRFDMLCVATSWTRFVEPGAMVSKEEKAFGIHGGDIETSVMLALDPSQVEMEYAENFPSFQSELANNAKSLRAYGPHAFGWKMQDLNTDGVTGDASQATAEKGEALLDAAVSGLVGLISDMHDFDLAHFDQ